MPALGTMRVVATSCARQIVGILAGLAGIAISQT
jgi:hypothetical protein